MTRPAPPFQAVGLIGAGAVGQAVAGALVICGLFSEVLVASRTTEQTSALVADLEDMGTAFASPVRPYAARPVTMANCQAVVAPGPASPTPKPQTSGWAAPTPGKPSTPPRTSG
ncbi:NAD(P)-binding domain-containing protein [Streptomyces johnsoniae]|uniref:NAD(P)-binding domain-containing protein n=1 Tax=Streptomyces johnsoniae TaxID=3075532 RepID=UPI00374E1E72